MRSETGKKNKNKKKTPKVSSKVNLKKGIRNKIKTDHGKEMLQHGWGPGNKPGNCHVGYFKYR